jgi:PAS domain S-box-containing protein
VILLFADTLFNDFFQHHPLPGWIFDAEKNEIVDLNQAATNRYGYTKEEFQHLLLNNLRAALEQRTIFTQATKTGELLTVQLFSSQLSASRKNLHYITAVEISSKAEVQHDALALRISHIFNETTAFTDMLNEMCKEIANYCNCCFSELWLPGIHKDQLELHVSCSVNAAGELFYKHSSGINRFNLADGLPGHVWSTKKSLLVDVLDDELSFPRKEAAIRTGIRCLVCIPLLFQQQRVGVLITGTSFSREQTQLLTGSLIRMESFIGAKIHRKRMELEYQHLFDSLPDLICTADFKGRFLKINKAGAALLEYDEAELIGQAFDKFIHPADRKNALANAEKLVSGGNLIKLENRFITKSGKVKWLSWNCNTSPEEGLIFASSKDITREKKLQELVEDANSLARIGGWEIDLVQETIYWSDLVHKLHGTDPATFTPSLVEGIHFYREDFRELITAKINHTRETGETMDFEAVIVTKQEKELWVRVIGRAEWYEGKCTRIFGSFQDINDRKRLELRIQQILDSIGDAFFTMDRNYIVTYWNRRAEELLDVKRERILCRNLWEIFPSAVNLPSYQYYKQVLETRETVNFEDYYGIWLEVNAYPSEEGVSVFFRDISLRKEADIRLQKAYEERTTILESIGDAFFAVDNNWIVTYWNKMAESVLFRKKEEILGRHLWTEYADAIDSDFYRKYHQAKETGKSVSFEDYYGPLDKWFEVTAYPSEAGLSVYFKDITLRKETDIRIREANERFEKVSEATNEAIWDWNIPENTLYWGSGFQTIFGHDLTKLSPTLESWTDHIPQDQREEILNSFVEVVQDPSQYIWEKEYQYIKADGTIAMVIDRAIIIRNPKGEAIRAVGALQDITYRKKMEEELIVLNEDLKVKIRELEQANEELEQFAFIASHDLQEPLRMVSSFMEQLKRKYESQLDHKAHQYIHYAMDGSKRMKRIILDLLDYSRAGRISGGMEEVSLEEIIKEYLYLRNKIISEKKAILLMGDLPEVYICKVPLIQTLHSLLDNALKYTRPDQPPKIHLTVEEMGKEWVIAIKDNGIGIQKQHFDKIFVIFQRLHNRNQYEGTGIGLAMVKKHVESWGGRIWLESEPGIGTTFYFTINKKGNA